MRDNNQLSQIVIYKTPTGETKIDVRFDGETVWLTQAKIAELFGVDRSVITKHLRNIYVDGEVTKEATCAKIAQVQNEGNRKVLREIEMYHLDVILSVGYRVRSKQATHFRIWATQRLNEYLRKGFTMNDEFLKNSGGGKYWYELLDRIRDIRSSEKVLYRQVLDLYATSIDYNPRSSETIQFFKTVQNKLHFAAHGSTAAEVIATRANAGKPFMGLLSFTPGGVCKKDIDIAKNYLNETELKILNNIVSAFFDMAEVKAMEQTPMYMKDWARQLDRFIAAFDKKVLSNAGSVSHEQAEKKAKEEYKKYQTQSLNEVERSYLASLKQIEKRVQSRLKK